MAATIAVAPLALALALRSAEASTRNFLLVAAGLLWLIGFVTYRGFSKAHERWRRVMLRSEIAEARTARAEASAGFRDALNEQYAMLDRIVRISETTLTEGIIDPSRVLDNIGLINSRAREAQDLIEDALAEIDIESGSTNIVTEPVEIRTLVEDIAAPFIRNGNTVTTGGPQHIAETDSKVLRLILRGLVESAIGLDANEVDISIMRNESSVVCTVADDGPDRSSEGLAGLSPVTKTLAFALSGNLEYDRALDWNRYSISLPEAVNASVRTSGLSPLDVLGTVDPQRTEPAEQAAAAPRRVLNANEDIAFPPEPNRGRKASVGTRRESTLTAR